MSFEEKRAWIQALVPVATYVVYVSIILARAGDTPLAEVSYVATLLLVNFSGAGVSVLLVIVAGLMSPREARKKDERDRAINRFGEFHNVGLFAVIGGLSALVMAMAEVDHFWIANVLYLAFILSAIVGNAAKIVAYHRGFDPW
jgi:MFS family permease